MGWSPIVDGLGEGSEFYFVGAMGEFRSLFKKS